MVSTPTAASPSALRSPTPFSRVTGQESSSARVMGTSVTTGSGLLDPEQVGVERLAAVVDLGRHPGPVLVEPLGDAPGVGRGRPLALDHGDDLVLVAHQQLEQAAGGVAGGRGDGLDAVA